MKIALISMPRVGSNYLFDKLKTHFQYNYIHEPYTPYANGWDFKSEDIDDDFIYKGLIYHCPTMWENRSFYENELNVNHYATSKVNNKITWNKLEWCDIDKDVNEFMVKVQSNYDKVIYLDGLDMDRIVESYTIAYITGEWFKKTDYGIKYPKEKYVVSESEDKEHWREFLSYYQRVLKAFATKENYFTYEGLIKEREEREKLNNYLLEEIKWK